MQHSQQCSATDQAMMRHALSQLNAGLVGTNPNPMVGCVITQNNKIIGEGWHRACGLAHAEIEALNNCSISAKGATLYVSLTLVITMVALDLAPKPLWMWYSVLLLPQQTTTQKQIIISSG